MREQHRMIMPNEFEQLCDAYYHAWFRFHPEIAVDVGLSEHAGRLTPYADDEFGALLTLNEKLLGSLEELDSGHLNPDQLIDFEIVRGAAFLEIEDLMQFDWRRRNPQRYLPLNAIYQLTVRDVQDFPAALSERLAAIPSHLRGARRYLNQEPGRIPNLWLESTILTAETGMAYLRGLPKHPKVRAHIRQMRDLETLINDAIESLAGFSRFLEREIGERATGDFACGEARFAHLLQFRHFLDVKPNTLHALGQQLFDQTQRDLVRVCRELSGTDDIAALTRKIQADHPEPAQLLSEYEKGMRAARKFVADKDLVTLPQDEQLAVVATPEFLRHQIPFAAYMEPAPADPKQQGYYYVTPAEDPELLAEHNRIGLLHTCVHEAYPGHHLQFVTANREPVASTYPRLLNPSATLYEGWALYCEQLMHEQGFLDQPEQGFLLLKDRLWRAMRIMIDVEIQTRDTSVEQAAQRMQQHLSFPLAQAMGDLRWYSHSPSTPMGYATGWSMINAARDRLRAEQPQLELKQFHDALLSCGSIALPLVLRRSFGDKLERSVHHMLFGALPSENSE